MSINFRSTLHQALLGYYFTNPDAEHYVRDLSRLLSFDATSLSRELASLTRAGIFLSSHRGREKYFRINRAHPLYNQLREITMHIVAKKATNRR